MIGAGSIFEHGKIKGSWSDLAQFFQKNNDLDQIFSDHFWDNLGCKSIRKIRSFSPKNCVFKLSNKIKADILKNLANLGFILINTYLNLQ